MAVFTRVFAQLPLINFHANLSSKVKFSLYTNTSCVCEQQRTRLLDTLGSVAQSVTCLATDTGLAADTGVASSIQAMSHTFVEIDYEILSMVILLPSAESFKKGCLQLQAKVCARSLFKLAKEKCMVR